MSSALPSAKDRKYDRQLRLWASSGQKALEEAHICLVGATAAGTEIVKNLVLPGIGKLTVVDGQLVTGDDLSNNFFVDEEFLGKSRALAVESLVKELNPQVESESISKSAAEIVRTEPTFFDQFSLVIACDVDPTVLSAVNELLFDKNVPLIVADTVGFYGALRISKKEHTTIELHPDSLVDLHLTDPWDELAQFSQTFDLSKLDESDLSHVPYVVLLLKALDKYKAEHDGEIPVVYADKKQLREELTSQGIKLQDGQNFEEAAGAVLRAVQKSQVPASVQQLCDALDLDNLDKTTSDFWFLVGGLKQYIQQNSLLPQPGVLPDMKSDTKSFIQLQTIYRNKARADATIVAEHVKKLTGSAGRPDIPFELVETFCKNARYIRATFGSKVVDSIKLPANASLKDENNLFGIYLGIQAFKHFKEQHDGRAPGASDAFESIDSIASSLASTFGHGEPLSQSTKKFCKEIVRAGGTELHNVAALLGGLGGQEAIKLLTHQYGALDNTVVYDGITAKTEAFHL